MKRIVSFIVVLAVAMCGMTQVMAQKSITKEAKKGHSCISPWQYNHVIQRS